MCDNQEEVTEVTANNGTKKIMGRVDGTPRLENNERQAMMPMCLA